MLEREGYRIENQKSGLSLVIIRVGIPGIQIVGLAFG